MHRQLGLYPGHVLMCPGKHILIIDNKVLQLLFEFHRQVGPYSGYSVRVFDIEDNILKVSS